MDLRFRGEGFDAIDSSRRNTGQHGGMLGEGGREGNAVFAGCGGAAKGVVAQKCGLTGFDWV